MTVFEVHYDNRQTHEDHYHCTEKVFISKELAQQYADLMNKQPKDEYEDFIYEVIEHIVLTELPEMV